jgi:hypothetical protein
MTRGLRNNNPLNIEISKNKPWKGEVRPSQDIRFAQFKTMAYGYRAAFKLLYNYQHLHGCEQLADFINRWAPPSENNTHAYINFVAERCRMADISKVDTKNEYQMCKIVAAMSRMENGIEPNMEDIKAGWRIFISTM